MPQTAIVKRRRGRPSALDDPAVVAKLVAAFEVDATVEEACAYAEVSEDAFYREQSSNPDFRDEMQRAKQKIFLMAKKAVSGTLQKGDGRMGLDFLKARQPQHYGEKAEHHHFVTALSLPELRARENQLRQRIAALEGGTDSGDGTTGTSTPRLAGASHAGAREADVIDAEFA